MKRTLLSLLAATTLVAGAPTFASAQAWTSVNQRQAQLDQRIDAGVRSGQLSQQEAARLRTEFASIARLESQYRRDGLSSSERADLDRRFDQLSNSIRVERADRDRNGDRGNRGDQWDRNGNRGDQRDRRGRWENLNQRQAQFTQRLNRAVADRRISRRQADTLTAEFNTISRLEQRYRRNGLTNTERADLDARFDRLQANFRSSVNSTQYGNGYGEAPNLFDYLFGIR
ncbi:MAG: hypothetical protein JWO33_718 [Caulobacteraceae bacterium]|nr:hypothetical protein [Caulobacteraceae bacterium]